MILRRLSQSLKEQNWMAIVIEFILLVAGVFLGIQVANWNAERVDASRGQAYLERINADLGADLANYHDRLRFWGGVSVYGAKGLAYAETGDANGATQWDLLLDYPCKIDLPEGKISAAAKALRANENFVPSLQLRFADIETALANLQDYNPVIFNNLREIAGRKK